MIYFVMFLVFLAVLVCGVLIFAAPASAIRIQQKFYEKINWRMEPISMEKELRNTRYMGMFLTALSLAALGYIAVNAFFRR